MRKSLKIIGIVILLFVLIIGSIFTSIVFMNGELQTNTVEETRAKFGEFDNDQILKKVELRGLKISILKAFGIFASAFKSKNNIRRIVMPREEKFYTEMVKVLEPLGLKMLEPGKFIHYRHGLAFDFSAVGIDDVIRKVYEDGKNDGYAKCQDDIKSVLDL